MGRKTHALGGVPAAEDGGQSNLRIYLFLLRFSSIITAITLTVFISDALEFIFYPIC